MLERKLKTKEEKLRKLEMVKLYRSKVRDVSNTAVRWIVSCWLE